MLVLDYSNNHAAGVEGKLRKLTMANHSYASIAVLKALFQWCPISIRAYSSDFE